MTSIEINSISKSYGSVKALDSITLSVQPSELFGLIGPDGAGKTTLIRILSTLLIPDSGNVIMQGFNVVSDYKTIRTKIGYMPQRFSLYPDLTVKENLNFFATVFNTTIEENYDLIKDIYSQIEMFNDRKAGKLSGGMKQKLGLSCALIHKPEVLILDEPTTGVDAVSRKEFWEILSNLKEKGITIIVSTPYMDEAELCDRVALIQKGKILSIDKPENLYTRFDHKLFEIKSDSLYKVQEILREEFPQSYNHLFGQSLHFSSFDENTNPENVQEIISSSGFSNVNVRIIHPGIEDCFIYLMNKKSTD